MTNWGLSFDPASDIPVSEIGVSNRLRRLDEAHVEGLMHSIETQGITTPIIVAEAGTENPMYRLLAGAHRLEAVRRLTPAGSIPARIARGDEAHLRLVEIDENLIRHELRPWDRAVFLVERKRVYDILHPEAKPGAKGRQVIENGQTAKLAVWAGSFSADTAERLGMGRRSVERAVSIVQSIAPALHDTIAALPIADNQSELQALAKEGPEREARVIELMTRDEDRVHRVRDAVAMIDNRRVTPREVRDKAFQKLVTGWDAAPKAARTLFLQHLRDTGQLPS
jgi:ParB family chromosome partitioning protein